MSRRTAILPIYSSMSQTMESPTIMSLAQREVMEIFYGKPHTEVALTKKQYWKICKEFRETRVIPEGLSSLCPALDAEMRKALTNDKNLQPGVASECSYAQTLANMLGLKEFSSLPLSSNLLSEATLVLLSSKGLTPRYTYSSTDGELILIQAGSPGGTDAALIDTKLNKISTIEFKERVAKVSEADLPAYDETGQIISTEEFRTNHSNYQLMLDEQIVRGLNIWLSLGTNIKNFTKTNVLEAVTSNFVGNRSADVICVEGGDKFLSMVPASHASLWANVKGEIRPVGKNYREVWTPNKLKEMILESRGEILNGDVVIPLVALKTSTPRGGNGEINRYKIGNLFFVYAKEVKIQEGKAYFRLNSVNQNKATISAHLSFSNHEAHKVAKYYGIKR